MLMVVAASTAVVVESLPSMVVASAGGAASVIVEGAASVVASVEGSLVVAVVVEVEAAAVVEGAAIVVEVPFSTIKGSRTFVGISSLAAGVRVVDFGPGIGNCIISWESISAEAVGFFNVESELSLPSPEKAL